MRPVYLLPLLLFVLPVWAFGGTVRGRVTDARTGEPLVGSVVFLKDTPHNGLAGLDGSFVLRDVAVGDYELIGQLTGYTQHIQSLHLVAADAELTLELRLTDRNLALTEVVVQGQADPEQERSARRLEQLAPSVTNVVSAQAIQTSPDITVANVLQRVSGVTLERSSSGDGRYATLRGMDKRYNYTLVNGIKIPSPDPYNRYVPLDIFPADLLQRLEVTKALTPSMEGDAIGGVVNLVMKDAPAEPTLSGQLGSGYGQLYLDRPFVGFDRRAIQRKSPAERFGPNYQAAPADFPWLPFTHRTPAPNLVGNLSYGRRFGKAQRLGVLLAGSYQGSTRGSDGYFYDLNIGIDNRPQLKELRVQRYSTRQQRAGLNAKLDYHLGEGHTLRFYGVYLRLDEEQTRAETDTTYKLPARADVDVLLRSRYQRQGIANATLQGQHAWGRWTGSWSAVYSRATNEVPDLAQQPLKLTSSGNRYQDAPRIWLDNRDQDRALYLNLGYRPAESLELTLGGLYRDKDRQNRFLSYQLRASGQPAQDEHDIRTESYTVFNPLGIYVGANNYSATERIAAGYGQLRYTRGALEVLGGVRLEHTDQGYLTSLPVTEDAYRGQQLYLDMLPSLHLRYALRQQQNLRLSYFASVSRPSYFEITPYNNSGSVTDTYPEAGNPYLLRTQAHNLDLRYELFGAGHDQVLAGVFYKRIKNPIEYALVTLPNTTVTVYQPNNFGTATNYGFEWVGTRFWGSVGLSTNYTFTVSDITTEKARVATTADPRTRVAQQRPLQGQAKHVGNASLLYKNVRNGWDVQLAYVYTGARIVQVNRFVGLDYWQRAQSQLDLAAEKRLTKADARSALTVYVKVQNLLNTPYQVDVRTPNPYGAGDYHYPYQDRADRLVVANQTYKAYYLAGLRFRL